MKKSRYNVFYETPEKNWLVYNLISDGLAVVSPEEYGIIRDILDNPNSPASEELLEGLITGRFLVEDNVDELKLLRTKYLNKKYSNETLQLTILPTFSCNFDCPYCYQKQLAEKMEYNIAGNMTEEVANGIIEYLRKATFRFKTLSIDWFGGEPLLKLDLIIRMSMEIKSLCEDNSCEYRASITTNGYLLTPEVAERLKRAGVVGALITIDGPPDVHNRHRPLKSGEGTFETILSNVKNSLNHLNRINLRVNVDDSNVDTLEDLLEILEAHNLNTNRVKILATPTVYDEEVSRDLEFCQVDSDLFSEKVSALFEKAINKGFQIARPTRQLTTCAAQRKNSYTITPDGSVFKCPSLAGDPEIRDGYIDLEEEEIVLNYSAVEWLDWSSFDKEICKNCTFLPICLGSCPYNDVMQNLFPTKDNLPHRTGIEKCQQSVEKKLKTYLFYDYEQKHQKGCMQDE